MPFRHLAAALLFACAATPALACRIAAQLDPTDVQYADVVVTGHLANYRIVLDQEIRRQRRKELANPNLSPEYRKLIEDQTQFMSDYARFDIVVDGVLKGKAPKRLTVTWDNSTFGEPDTLPPGPYLIALRDPASQTPPLRGPSTTILPNREPKYLTVLQAPCAPPFLFPEGSDEATTIRQGLAR